MSGINLISSLRREWRRKTGAGRRAEVIAQSWKVRTLEPHVMARVAVASQAGFLYNRIQKNANSSLVALVHFLETGRSAGIMSSRCNVSHLDEFPIARIGQLADFPRMVVIRCPFERTLSAFLNKVDTARFRSRIGLLEATQDGFSRFLNILDDGGLTLNSHWDLQTRQMLFRPEGYTDVIRFENLEAELGGFLDRRGIDPDVMYGSGAFRNGRTHRTDAGNRLRQFYNDREVAIVKRLYADDFAELGYDTSPRWNE